MASESENPFAAASPITPQRSRLKGSLVSSLHRREVLGRIASNRVNVTSRFIPDTRQKLMNVGASIFCGSFSNNGEVFMSASQGNYNYGKKLTIPKEGGKRKKKTSKQAKKDFNVNFIRLLYSALYLP